LRARWLIDASVREQGFQVVVDEFRVDGVADAACEMTQTPGIGLNTAFGSYATSASLSTTGQ